MIMVTGATGNVGGELVAQLVAAGHPVRALVRNPDGATVPAGAEQVSGDLNQPESLAGALAGVRGVFLLSGYQDMPGVLTQLRRAGVEHVVLLSTGAVVGGSMRNAITRYNIVSEAAVRQSRVPCTILRPSGFMSNTLQWAPQVRAGEVVRAPFADVPIAAIDPADIATVAAQLLLSSGPDGASYRLTGPEAIRPADQVRVLASVLGRDLRFEAQQDAEAKEEMSKVMPAEYVEAFFAYFVAGEYDDSRVLPVVQEITGRPPRTFEQWATTHADAFR